MAELSFTHKWMSFRCFIHLHFLIVSWVASSAVLSTPAMVVSPVGKQAVLPCSWKSRLGKRSLPDCHIQWQTPDETIFEQQGQIKWQAEEFHGRVAVPEDRLGSGDCSLIVSDVQLGDVGLYESFLVVDEAKLKTRIFIQSVQLSVYDHKSKHTLGVGEDLLLQLHTPKAVRVVYQSTNSTEWSHFWMRGDENTQHLEKPEDREELILRGLERSNEGMYKVLDEHGLAVSTIRLTVQELSSTRMSPRIQENQQLFGKALKNSFSSPLIALSFTVYFLLFVFL